MSWPDFEDLQQRQRAFSSVGGFLDGHIAVMAGTDRPRPVCRVFVTPGLLETLDARATVGRFFDKDDFEPGRPGVALLTDGLWHAHFGSDAAVPGRVVHLDEQPFTIVGVVPAPVFGLLQQRKGLFSSAARDRCVVTPLVPGLGGEANRSIDFARQQRDGPWLRVVGRLRPGASIEAAQSDLSALGRHLRDTYPSTNRKRDLQLLALADWRTADVVQVLLMLTVAALLAFVVACINAAGLVVTETIRGQDEPAVRLALGAGPSQLVGVVLLRAMLWSLPAAVAGVVFGRLILILVQWGASTGSDDLRAIPFGARTLMAGLALTLLAGLASGVVAAWTTRRRDLTDLLREGGHLASTSRRRARATRLLLALQFGTALALAIGEMVLIRSVWTTVSLDRGFTLERGFVVQVRLPRSRFPTAAEQYAFYQRALSRVRALPGVPVAGLSVAPPMSGAMVTLSGALAIESPAGTQTVERLSAQYVSAGYFEALGLKIRRGRFFSEQDEQSEIPAAVVDEPFCRRYLGNVDPLTSRLRFGRDTFSIVGVVGEVRQHTGREAVTVEQAKMDATVYLLFHRLRNAPTWSFLVVRASAEPAALAEATVREVLLVDDSACVDNPRTFTQLFGAQIADERRLLGLLGSFAGIVLLLTTISATGALTRFVTLHDREIALRRALGARHRHVLALLAKHVSPAVGGGLALGFAGGLALEDALAAHIFGLQPVDPATAGSALAFLAGAVVVAVVGPLWRACRIDTTSRLRSL